MKIKHALWLRICHWINVPLILLMIHSGLLIYWANPAYQSWGFFPDWFFSKYNLERRLAYGMAVHFSIMWFIIVNGFFYLLYLFVSKHWREITPNIRAAKELIPTILHDLGLTKNNPANSSSSSSTSLYNAAQRFAYSSVIILIIVEVLSGFVVYKPVQLVFFTNLMGGYKTARMIHFVGMIFLVAFIVIHLLQVMRAGFNNFQAMITGEDMNVNDNVSNNVCDDEV